MKNFFLPVAGLLVFATAALAQPTKSKTKASGISTADDPYQTQLYWSLNDSPMQQRLRSLAPFPVGVVYYQQMDHKYEDIMATFRQIKGLGFPALKQIMIKGPLENRQDSIRIWKGALDMNLSPWYYGMGGWDPITPELTKKLGIKLEVNEANMRAIEEDPRMIKYQTDMLKRRVDNMFKVPPPPAEVHMGEPGRSFPFIAERQVPRFTEWLMKKYKTTDGLNAGWYASYTGRPYKSIEAAAKSCVSNKQDIFGNRSGNAGWEFTKWLDAMRFQSELAVGDYQRVMEHYTRFEPNEPKRTGGHQLFENQPLNGWDLEGQARSASIGGSFYSSIHLAHHFFLTEGEVTRPVYVQARIIADNFKGGWAATWESTGGPTQWSGTHPFTVDGPMISRLMMSYLAAGLKGIGFWSYNSRDVGWEAGEYALTNLQGQPSERAHVAANITKAIDKHRFELWKALDEPTVGILYSWDNEAVLARMSLGGYPLATRAHPVDRNPAMAQYYSEARVGVSRALMNNNVPFEYVSDRDLKAGFNKRYKVIYLPYMAALSQETVQLLKQYVAEGGRLVADMPLLVIDQNGVLNKYVKGSDFEQLFGFQVADYQSTFNQPSQFDKVQLDGQIADVVLTGGKEAGKMNTGRAAVIENNFGKGSTLVFNFEASRQCFKPGNEALEQLLASRTLGNVKPEFSASREAMVFRRSAPQADHYFIINDSNAEKTVTITGNGKSYKSAADAMTGDNVAVTGGNTLRVSVPAGMGRWVRVAK